jgi:glycosyltransferase involved in cell wall biosynthesis
MTERLVKVLCLDIEGGFGGSSRSLFESLSYIDRQSVEPVVWCRKDGPITPRYADIGIECHVTPEMPRVTSVPRFSRNLAVYGYFLRDWFYSSSFRETLLETSRGMDLVHFNHEALFLLAKWFRQQSGIPTSMHIRTVLRESLFARWQERTILEAVDHQIFITENERTALEKLAGHQSNGSIIYNIATPPVDAGSRNRILDDDIFVVACLSNYDWVRGTDRLIDVAEVLARMDRRDIRFVVAGHIVLNRNLPGELGEIGRRGGTLSDYAKARGVADMFEFRGHVSDPENVLAMAHVLAKPTREANPWGRDIIEGLAAGVPIITCGQYDRFVEDGVTGVLLAGFDPDTFARRIVELADNRDHLSAMTDAAKLRAADKCNGPARAADLLAVWRQMTSSDGLVVTHGD